MRVRWIPRSAGPECTEVLGWGNDLGDEALVLAKGVAEQAKGFEQKVEYVVEEEVAGVTHRGNYATENRADTMIFS